MSNEFANYIPVQDIITKGRILTAIENITESSKLIDPETAQENISQSVVVTIT